MRTLTRRLVPHTRAAWLTFALVVVVALVVAMSAVVLNHGGRTAVVLTAFAWLVAVVVLAAFLDAVLLPGEPDVRRRRAGHTAGWSGTSGAAGWFGGGDHGGSGDGGSSCS